MTNQKSQNNPAAVLLWPEMIPRKKDKVSKPKKPFGKTRTFPGMHLPKWHENGNGKKTSDWTFCSYWPFISSSPPGGDAHVNSHWLGLRQHCFSQSQTWCFFIRIKIKRLLLKLCQSRYKAALGCSWSCRCKLYVNALITIIARPANRHANEFVSDWDRN